MYAPYPATSVDNIPESLTNDQDLNSQHSIMNEILPKKENDEIKNNELSNDKIIEIN